MVVGFVLRFALAIGWAGLNTPPEDGADPQEYDTYAWNLAQGRGYRGMSPDVKDQDHLTAYRPPGIALVWSAVYKVVGHRYDAIRVLHCLFSAGTIGLTFVLGNRLYGPTVGWLAAITYAVFPSVLLYSTELISEPISTFIFLAYLTSCLSFYDSPHWRHALLAGLLLGFGMLCRPATMFMIPLTVLWLAWLLRKDKQSVLVSLLIPLVAAIVLLPWVIRNYLVFEKFVPFATMGGSALLQGNNRIVAMDPALYGYSIWDTKIPEYRDALIAPNNEYERDKIAGSLARTWILENPGVWLSILPKKMARGWTPFLQPHTSRLFRWGTLLSWGPVLLLFLISVIPTFVSAIRAGKPDWILHLGILHFVATTLIFFGNARYRHSIEPLCFILAAVTLRSAMMKLRP